MSGTTIKDVSPATPISRQMIITHIKTLKRHLHIIIFFLCGRFYVACIVICNTCRKEYMKGTEEGKPESECQSLRTFTNKWQ